MELPLGDVVRSVQSVYWLCGLAALSASLLLLLLLQLLAKSSSNEGQRSAIAVKNNKRAKGSATVLLVGPMGAGKTSFYGKLVYGAAPATHTSMTASSAMLSEKNIQLVDLPGHPRLRSHLLAQHLAGAQGVVFMIDPATNASATSIQATAEHLHVLLGLLRTMELKGVRDTPPVLLQLSKSDTWTAIQKQRSQERVKSALERELEKRRKASAAAGAAGQARLESIDELPSGSSGSAFSFFNLFRSSTTATKVSKASSGSVKLPEDEQEILQSDVLDFDGPFAWEQLGISIDWATSSAKTAAEKEKDSSLQLEPPQEDAGTAGFWKWIDAKVS